MRLVHLRSSRGYYGAEALIENLAVEQAARGHEVIVAGLDDPRERHLELVERVERRGLPALRVASEGRFALGVPRRLAQMLRETRAELLHVHDYKTSVLGLLAAWLAHVPVVCTFHGEVAEGAKVRTYQALARLALRFYHGVATVSQEQLGLFTDSWRRSPALFLPNAIDVELWVRNVDRRRSAGDARAWRQAQGLAEDNVLVGTLARLAEDKGHCLAMDGVEAALRDHPRMIWLLAGEGEERARIEWEVHRRGLERQMRLLGFVEDQSLLYAALDLFLLPSLREGLPMVVLEAMSAGLPVLACPVGEIPQVVTQECGVLLQDRAAHLTTSLSSAMDERRRRSWGEAGRARVRQEYSIQTLASRYEEELYLPALRGLLREQRGSRQRGSNSVACSGPAGRP